MGVSKKLQLLSSLAMIAGIIGIFTGLLAGSVPLLAAAEVLSFSAAIGPVAYALWNHRAREKATAAGTDVPVISKQIPLEIEVRLDLGDSRFQELASKQTHPSSQRIH